MKYIKRFKREFLSGSSFVISLFSFISVALHSILGIDNFMPYALMFSGIYCMIRIVIDEEDYTE